MSDRKVYIPIDIVRSIIPYTGYIPTDVRNEWRLRVNPMNAIHALMTTYKNLETIISSCIYQQIEYVMRYIVNEVNSPQYIHIPYNIDEVGIEAAKKGYINIVKWAVGKGATHYATMALLAVRNGHVGTTQYLLTLIEDEDAVSNIVLDAATYGYLVLVPTMTDMTTIAITAAQHGKLNVVMEIIRSYKVDYEHIVKAAGTTYINIIYAIADHIHDMNYKAKYAALTGDKATLHTLLNSGYYNVELIASNAAISGHIDIVSSMLRLGAIDYDDIAICAARGGYDNIVQLVEHMITSWDEVTTAAAEGGILRLIRIYSEHVSNWQYVVGMAAFNGYLDIIIYASDHVSNWPYIVGVAASNGYLDIILYASNRITDWESIAFEGAGGDYMDIVTYAISKGANDWNRMAEAASYNGNISMVLFLIGCGANNYHDMAVHAATNGHIEIIKIIHTYDIDWHSIACIAASNNMLDIVKYTLTQDTFPLEEVIECANEEHHIHISEYLSTISDTMDE